MWRPRTRIAVMLIAGLSACGGPRPLEWHDEAGYRWADLILPRSGKDGFQLLPVSRTGVTFTNSVTEEQAMQNEHLYNGAGVALGDMDGDGLADIYFSNLDGPNVLYRNLGDWRFEDVTEIAGVSAPNRFSTGAVFADTDGDGDLDLSVTTMEGPNAFFSNNGDGTFEEVTEHVGLVSEFYGTTQALADVDGDGDLDLYVANNKRRTVKDIYPPPVIAFDSVVETVVSGTPPNVDSQFVLKPEFREHYRIIEQPGRIMRFEYAEPDKFYLNDGTGRFEEVSFTSGSFLDEDGLPLAETPTDWGLTARFHDVDNDGDPDLYVCNDFESPDKLWINDGTGRFRLIDRLALRATSNATMTMDFSDINRDGHDDFLLIDMLDRSTRQQKTQVQSMIPAPVVLGEIDDRPQIGRNTLLLNRGDNTYAEIANFAGVEASGWTWSVVFIDVDLDGYEDVLLGNGHQFDFLDSDTRARIMMMTDTADWRRKRFLYPNLFLPNVAFRNNRDLTFDEVAADWGWATERDIAQGAAVADLDNDGDLDVVANRLGFTAALYRNESVRSRIAVRLKGAAPNTQGIGSKIRVRGGPVEEQHKEVIAGGMYVSGSDPVYTFATGEAEHVTIIVDWRSGLKSVIQEALPNRIYEIDESGAVNAAEVGDDLRARLQDVLPAEPFFSDMSALLDHSHTDADYDDFIRQPLLRHRLSQLGPGVTWHDFDRDRDDDLFVTTGKGGVLALYRNDRGRFTRMSLDMTPAVLDQSMILPLPGGDRSVLVGQVNYEAVSPSAALDAPSVLQLDLEATGAAVAVGVSQAVPGAASSTGP
ncbi:MAG: CRTAC1 family protein, partial [Gemmatimonadota bacterium]